ncbi:MAG: hypothetical protein PUG84_03190 [Peptoniphilaceae bacterium]|uniref:hypothetical protein n=1 Tax=Peptoniphilus sp. TaxID=1971214 RepID=UPI0029733510|nr:hypothetical protein [Peptoniphilus sp.]MDD7352448.1 hypothetical protein [Peptoniphilaceae bacterium]MDY3902433.1 hypothetical protein [Peptoniphilus sp.]
MRKMKRLLVIYDKEIQDKGRDSYLRLIKREIPSAEILDLEGLKENEQDKEYEKILILKPMKDEYYKPLTKTFEMIPSLDIEGQFTNQLTITAEAIIRVIGPVDKKTVVIINQSDVLGIPLAKELIERGANVISLNSSYPCIDNLLTMTDVDVLVSASGKYEFKLDRILTRMIDVKVDLSDDLEDPIKITSVPTVEVLKERLEE